jgi:hypothetical protein
LRARDELANFYTTALRKFFRSEKVTPKWVKSLGIRGGNFHAPRPFAGSQIARVNNS